MVLLDGEVVSAGSEARQIVARVGLWWPAADEGGLRLAAEKWDRAAEQVDDLAARARRGAGDVTEFNSGAAIDAFAGFWAKYDGSTDAYLPATAAACRQMAQACRSYADEVARAKTRVEEVAIEIGASLVAGTALAIFTAGLSEAAAAAVSESLMAAAEMVGMDVAAAVADIVAGVLVGGAVGAVEGFAVDVAVAQPVRVLGFSDGSFSWSEAATATAGGAAVGAVLGGAGRTLRFLRPFGWLPDGAGEESPVTSLHDFSPPHGVGEGRDRASASRVERVASGLKDDPSHRAASWVVDDPAARAFAFTGGDGIQRTLYQLPGELNGKGVFEWIIDNSGEHPVITHQRFILGGEVTGYPHQRP